MAALLKTIASSRRGRHHEETTDLDSVYGDRRITAPLGFPSTNTDRYVQEVGCEPDDDGHETNNRSRGANRARNPQLFEATGRNPGDSIEDKASQSRVTITISSERSRQRSRSQSSAAGKKEARVDHRIRSSSSNRAMKDQEARRRGSNPGRSFVQPVDHAMYSFPAARDDGHGDLISRLPTPANAAGEKVLRDQGVAQHIMTNHPYGQPKILYQSHSTEHAATERSHSPAVTILSPVSENFNQQEMTEDGLRGKLKTAPARLPARLLEDKSDFITSPSSIPDGDSILSTPDTSPHSKLLTFRHGAQFINPLAAHSPLEPQSEASQQPLRASHEPPVGNAVQSTFNDKPLPACPPELTRSPPLQCTAFMRASGRTGPGLGATSIMRPSSRNQHSQTYPQPQTRQPRAHVRSASLGRAIPCSSSCATAPSASQGRLRSNDVSEFRLSNQSLTESDFTSDSQSTRSASTVPTPQVSPDHNQLREMTTSPAEKRTAVRKQSADLRTHSPNMLLRRPTPAPSAAIAPNLVGGNIYNELRDDLADVARDLNEMNLASHLDHHAKPAKLRARARSSSRQGRRSERHHSKDFSNGYNYTYREMDKSELMGGWGNTVFVPAYDLPSTRLSDREHTDLETNVKDNISSKQQKIHAVPDYEDLWG